MAKTTRTEPDLTGQICGYQIAYGMPWSEYCAEPKARGKYFCSEHDLAVLEEDGPVRPYGAARGQ
ncbi:hypothetical protein ACIQNU_04270 [Streptomyces sp. NPDC091292]|uniref:hypothetical protein n=1 Tax=Streptomyces sp. NPDC091292 TaxID=3365991 RepID=UPI00381FDC4B